MKNLTMSIENLKINREPVVRFTIYMDGKKIHQSTAAREKSDRAYARLLFRSLVNNNKTEAPIAEAPAKAKPTIKELQAAFWSVVFDLKKCGVLKNEECVALLLRVYQHDYETLSVKLETLRQRLEASMGEPSLKIAA